MQLTAQEYDGLHTSKRMHFIEDSESDRNDKRHCPCIRQNVCTSLRIYSWSYLI